MIPIDNIFAMTKFILTVCARGDRICFPLELIDRFVAVWVTSVTTWSSGAGFLLYATF